MRRLSLGKALAAGAIVLFWILIYTLSEGLPHVRGLESQSLGLRQLLRGPLQPGDDIILVEIDDAAATAHGGWPISRHVLARAVRALSHEGAKIIAFDLLLTPSQGGAETDRDLAQAIEAAGNVLVPFALDTDHTKARASLPDVVQRHEISAYRLNKGQTLESVPDGRNFVVASPGIAEAARSAGHVNVFLDRDGSLRFEHLVLRSDNSLLPSMSLEILRLVLEQPKGGLLIDLERGIQVGTRTLVTETALRLPVNYYGPEGHFRSYSLSDLLSHRFATQTFKDKIVLIGANATAVGDRFETPFSRTLPGLEHHATVVDNLITDRYLRRTELSRALDLGAIVLGVLATAYVATVLPAPISVGLIVLLGLLWGSAATLALAWFSSWLSVAVPSGAILSSGLFFGVLRAQAGRREHRAIQRERRNLARFVPRGMADFLARNDSTDVLDRRQQVAVMFVDIVGFTRLSEALTPEEVMSLLRTYHGIVEEVVTSHNGTIDKFLGDGVMASFGLIDPSPRDSANALAAARSLVDELEMWNARRGMDAPVVKVGIGLHYGAAVVGTMGGQQQKQFSVGGDVVNVASRLEGLTRIHKARILASEDLIKSARDASDDTMLNNFYELPPQSIRGREGTVKVWALGTA